jgi:hypothetical protein
MTPSAEPRANAAGPDRADKPFRFFDNREKYLLFVTTCSEKWVIAERVGLELTHIVPRPPAIRLFDAGMGDATVLTKVMRQVHHRFPTVPMVAVAKEISVEDVRLGLEKMGDRFLEHPETVLAITNMRYSEAPALVPAGGAGALNWYEVALEGGTAHEFDQQIKALQPRIAEGWRTRTSESTGNPLYVVPSVLVLYREDRRFMLETVIPRPSQAALAYDLVVASQPFRARLPAEAKARVVLGPLVRSLAPGGRMITIQSTGRDPGMDIIRAVWPEEDPFRTSRHDLAAALEAELAAAARDYRFHVYPDHRSEFRFNLQHLPGELGNNIGTSTLLAAWNAAVYVAQVEDVRLTETLRSDAYLNATLAVLRKYGGLWFVDESFLVERLRG